MSFAVMFLPMALSGVQDIKTYLSQYSESTADKFITNLKDKVSQIKGNPFMHEIYQDDMFFRRAVVEDYLVFYNVNETEEIVRIHRILHGSKDLRHYLNKE